MKKTKRCIALAVSVLMLNAILPANFNTAYAAEKVVDGVRYIDADDDACEEFVEEGGENEVNYKELEEIPMGIVDDSLDEAFTLDSSEEEAADETEVLDDNFLEGNSELAIETGDIASVNAASSTSYYISLISRTRNSIKISWNDPDYASSSYTVVATATKSTSPQYGAADTKVLSVSNTNTVQITNLVGGMPYNIVIYKQGSVIAERTINTLADFLVLVGKSLYDDSSIKTSLNTYVQDLRYNEGIGAEILPISKNTTGTDIYYRSTPASLKALIKGRYSSGNGAKGFVIIGSGDDIPTAKAENGNEIWATDLYYADMDGTWTDSDSDGYFDDPLLDSVKYSPEMYFGRINPNGVVTSTADQISYVNNYLARIHSYRQYGNRNLSDTMRDRAFIFNDSACCAYTEPAASYSKLFTNIYNAGDLNETTSANLVSAFNNGYAMMNIMTGSGTSAHSICGINPSTGAISYSTLTLANLRSQLNSGAPKFNYMNMYCSYACQFENASGTALNNLGAYYLFNSNTGLNITGLTHSGGILTNPTFYNKLGNGSCIGEAFVDFCRTNNMFMNKQSRFELLGDPTLKYTFNKPSSATPYISTNVAGNIENGVGHYYEAEKGKPFTINLGDSDSTSVETTINGLPSGSTVVQGNKYRTITINTAGTYYITMQVFNVNDDAETINTFTERFHITVK